MQDYESQLSIPARWKAWRQRLRGDEDELLTVFEKLTMPKRPTPRNVDERVRRAAALCDAALFKLWLAGIGPPKVSKRLQQRKANLVDLGPGNVINFVDSLVANGVADEEFAELTRPEFDQCWHKATEFRYDLVGYLFRPDVYLERAIQAQEDIRDLMKVTDDFYEFVTAAASREVRSAINDPLVALGSFVAASLPGMIRSGDWSPQLTSARARCGRRFTRKRCFDMTGVSTMA